MENNNDILVSVLTDLGLPKLLHREVRDLMKMEIVKKGNSFIERNSHAQKIGIVITGILEAKFLDGQGIEYTANYYYPEGTRLVSDYRSFIENHRTEEVISALDDTCLMVLYKKDFETLFNKYTEFQKLSKELLDKNFILAVKRIRYFQMYKSKERVEQFLKKHPLVFKFATKQSIASFLGMHRNALQKALDKI